MYVSQIISEFSPDFESKLPCQIHLSSFDNSRKLSLLIMIAHHWLVRFLTTVPKKCLFLLFICLQHTPALPDQPNNVAGSGAVQVKETKVIYHIDEEETPYLVKRENYSIELIDDDIANYMHLNQTF